MKVQLVTSAQVVVTVDLDAETVDYVMVVADEVYDRWTNAVADDGNYNELEMPVAGRGMNDEQVTVARAIAIAGAAHWPHWSVV